MAKGSWDDEEESSGSAPASPQITARRGKFDDEEEEDVLESWDAAEDSEVEREKAKKAADAKAKADEEAKKNHKSKSQRIEEKRQENMRRRREEEDYESEEEDEAERRARLRREQQESDLKHAEDLFGGVGGVPASRSAPKAVTVQDEAQPGNAIDLSSLSIFDPTTKDQFAKLREVLVPLLSKNARKAQYTLFMQEFAKEITKELPSDQIKKIASSLTTLSNEKMREEKEAQKGGKKTKAAKTKTTLVASRNMDADTTAYEDGLDDGDFM